MTESAWLVTQATCPICSNADTRLARVADRGLCVCSRCGYVFLDPREVNNLTNPNEQTDSMDYYASQAHDWKAIVGRWDARVNELRSWLPELAGTRALDYGAGPGYFVRALVNAGCNAAGVEISESCIKYSREILGVEMWSRDEFEQITRSGSHQGAFNLVTTYHVLEHLDHPGDLASKIAQLLCSGGIWSIEVPNILSYEAIRAKGAWHGLALGIHRGFLTRSSIPHLLGDAFELIDVRTSVAQEFYDDFLPYMRMLTDDQDEIARLAAGLSGTVIVFTAKRRPR